MLMASAGTFSDPKLWRADTALQSAELLRTVLPPTAEVAAAALSAAQPPPTRFDSGSSLLASPGSAQLGAPPELHGP